MTILITGSNGILGRSIPDIKGHEIIRTDKDTLDITDFYAVNDFIRECRPDVIIHLASIVGSDCEKDKDYTYKVNVRATDHLIKIAKENGLRRFIFTSTCAVYNQKDMFPTMEFENEDPRSYYGLTKYLAEQKVLKECDEAIIFRIFNIYGGKFNHSLVNKLASGKEIILFNPDTYFRDYIHYTDVVKFIIKAIDVDYDSQEVVNLGSGVVRSTTELLKIFKKEGIEPNCKLRKDGDVSISWADITKLNDIFNDKPEHRIMLK